jgi:aryl-alcohol dehydrogenase-like predicted oxidoreductase
VVVGDVEEVSDIVEEFRFTLLDGEILPQHHHSIPMTNCTLGFGCASIQGRVGRRQSLEALAAAYDAGIRHFDIARSYGWGKAEGLLGEFLQGRPRQDYTLVTKCGLVPTKPSHLKSAARTVAQRVFRLVPASRGLIRKLAASNSQPSRTTDIGVLSNSLDDSLHALRTDYVDTLLLHNFTPDYPELERVIEFFERKKDEGKVRRYGFSVHGDLTAGLERLGRVGIEGEVLVQAPVSVELLCLERGRARAR